MADQPTEKPDAPAPQTETPAAPAGELEAKEEPKSEGKTSAADGCRELVPPLLDGCFPKCLVSGSRAWLCGCLAV